MFFLVLSPKNGKSSQWQCLLRKQLEVNSVPYILFFCTSLYKREPNVGKTSHQVAGGLRNIFSSFFAPTSRRWFDSIAVALLDGWDHQLNFPYFDTFWIERVRSTQHLTSVLELYSLFIPSNQISLSWGEIEIDGTSTTYSVPSLKRNDSVVFCRSRNGLAIYSTMKCFLPPKSWILPRSFNLTWGWIIGSSFLH